VEESGFGKYSADADVIAKTVNIWLQSPEMLVSMQQAAFEASRPKATIDIARDLADLVFKAKEMKTKRLGGSKSTSVKVAAE
jgi:hypothetical protein